MKVPHTNKIIDEFHGCFPNAKEIKVEKDNSCIVLVEVYPYGKKEISGSPPEPFSFYSSENSCVVFQARKSNIEDDMLITPEKELASIFYNKSERTWEHKNGYTIRLKNDVNELTVGDFISIEKAGYEIVGVNNINSDDKVKVKFQKE
jgi:hypothetical protein